MNLLFTTLLAAGLIAICHAACDVCNCERGPGVFTEEYFNANIRDEWEATEYRYFVPVTKVKVVNCELVLECDFPERDESQTNVQAAVGPLGTSTGFNLQGTNCVDGTQWHSENEGDIQYVGCFIIVSKY
ncbi:hypothetical protein CAEBREN_20664 [Caenorhabditis brenneri]|uniref:Uncharacterized protein n=1 Tax=Caenorhabditis brenneri TaxID=135651 RepID=G0NHK5_CAEBE|nr:hypothetical protein CAEBREN_20664 [Caenorhabditis brenneri]